MQTKKDDKKLKFRVKARVSGLDSALEYKIISDTMGNLTKAKAYEFLELKTFTGERAVRENHVQFLFDEQTSGRFLWHHVLIASAVLGQEEFRINGQHTCWMRVNVPEKDEPVKAEVRFIKYRVDSSDHLRKLYSAFDRNAPRTVGHVSNVMLIDTTAGRELPRSTITQMVAGFRIFFAEDWRTANANPNELASIISNSYAEVFNVAGHFLAQHRDEHSFIRRASVAAAMLATFEKAVKPSGDFWEPVFTGLGLNEAQDARYQLRNYLMTHGNTAGNRDMIKVSAEDMFRVCVQMWNRWRKGEKVHMVKTLDQRVKAI